MYDDDKKWVSFEKLNDDVKIVKGFCYLENELNACGDSEITVVAKTKNWMDEISRTWQNFVWKVFSKNGKVYERKSSGITVVSRF